MEKTYWPERILDRLFPHKIIYDGCDSVGLEPNRPRYMKRWFIIGNDEPEGWTKPHLLLHLICRSDMDRELHDHPFDFTAIILWRGYFEETERIINFVGPDGKLHEAPACEVPPFSIAYKGWFKLKRKWPGMVLRRRAEHRHRVQLVDGKPSWSLVFTSGKNRDWGFWRDGKFISHRIFISRRCEEEARKKREAAQGKANAELAPTMEFMNALPKELPYGWVVLERSN